MFTAERMGQDVTEDTTENGDYYMGHQQSRP